ncbi:MAG: hypothetical protein AAF288_04400 [Planctomycetota bacterium]
MKRHTRIAETPSRRLARPASVALALALLAGFDAGSAAADEVIVELNNGQTLVGELVREDAQQITVADAETGRNRILPRSSIASVTPRPSAAQEYARRSAELEPEDLDGRWNLAYDMHERKAHALALQELDALAQRFPRGQNASHDRIYFLRDAVRQSLAQAQAQSGPRGQDGPSSADQARTASTPASKTDRVLNVAEPQTLTPEQINLLKVWELPADLSDPRLVVRVDRRTLETVLDRFSDSLDPALRSRRGRSEFLREDGWKHAEFLFELEARDFYKDIQVVRGPDTLQEFARRFNPGHVCRYFAPRFASGQTGLFLFTSAPGLEAQALTNFLILSQASTSGGLRYINRDEPAKSLLVQWSLPRGVAELPAPDVPGWTPAFSGLDDPDCVRLVDWIASLYSPQPEYGIDYTPPVYTLPVAPGAQP